jgi:hypothetical protein
MRHLRWSSHGFNIAETVALSEHMFCAVILFGPLRRPVIVIVTDNALFG